MLVAQAILLIVVAVPAALSDSCRDLWNEISCKDLVDHDGCNWTEELESMIVLKACPKSCGLCGDGVKPTHKRSDICRDLWDTRSCQAFAVNQEDGCNLKGTWGHIAKLCKKTCGICGGGVKPTHKPTPSATTPDVLKSTTTKRTTGGKTSSPRPTPSAGGSTSGSHCPRAQKFGTGPPADCPKPTDPLNKPSSGIESWFTKEMFNDLFPNANIGWGPVDCWPYSYESFVIAARYFPRFGTESPNSEFTPEENHKRDLAAFFAHAIQETGENNPGLYRQFDKEQADNCFYRGGFFNWYEGGPTSAFLDPAHPGHQPEDGKVCNPQGRYCSNDAVNRIFNPCNTEKSGSFYKGCYFGRGAIQISYNFNYGPFSDWLNEQGVEVNLLEEPWQVMVKSDPPLAIMASLWFYMTPQPPKPAMHDIILGAWEPGEVNRAAGYSGPIFGPTSLVINNECGGEDPSDPGGAGESRRIKAFKWFSKYFKFPIKDETTLTCKNMKQKLGAIGHKRSYGPDWSSTWKKAPCQCAPLSYGGPIPYFEDGFYPEYFVQQNPANKKKCEDILKKSPQAFGVSPGSECLKY